MSIAPRSFTPDGYFVLRTPLLPLDELLAWSSELAASTADDTDLAAALAADRVRLRRRLAAHYERPEVQEALYLASPSLAASLPAWRAAPDDDRGRKIERALVRYLARMTARSTPNNLLAGTSFGRVGDHTELALAERASYRRTTELSPARFQALGYHAHEDRALLAHARIFVNTTAWSCGDQIRYATWALRDGDRIHALATCRATPAVTAALAAARPGCAYAELVAAIARVDNDAVACIDRLLADRLLVTDFEPPASHPDPLAWTLQRLTAAGRDVSELARAGAALRELDAGGLGASPERYRTIAAGADDAAFVVDLEKPARAVLDPRVLAEILRGVELLNRLSCETDPIDTFRSHYRGRYEDTETPRLVPLLELVDPELGIGFRGPVGPATPLVDGLAIRRRDDIPSVPFGAREQHLLALLTDALARGATAIELSDDDIARLTVRERPLPDGFAAFASISTPAPGELCVHVGQWRGPSAARLLAKNLREGDELTQALRRSLAHEEALRPDVVFADVVHASDGRALVIDKVVQRPVLRRFEIPLPGRASALADDHQIRLDDLHVRVTRERVQLWSERLGKEVVPRVSNAMRSMRAIAPYQLLMALQSDGVAPGIQGKVAFNWAPFEHAAFLPRVTSGRVILALARWRLTAAALGMRDGASDALVHRAVRAARERHRIPRWVSLLEPSFANDQLSPIDLDNVLCLDSLVHQLRRSGHIVLFEMFPAPAELVVHGPEGRFVHELVVPFSADRTHVEPSPAFAPRHRRHSVPPGGAWQYLRLFVAPTEHDRVLVDCVGPLCRDAIASGQAERWFFVRYPVPQPHLRVRLRGRLDVAAALAPWLGDHGVRSFELATYDPEIERYGGPEAYAVCEAMFHADSDAAIALLALDPNADARWLLALAGIARWFDAFALSPPAQLAIVERICARWEREYAVDRALRAALGERHRANRPRIEALLAARADDPVLARGLEILGARDRILAPLAAEIAPHGEAVLPSLVHLHANRMLAWSYRQQELVLYDHLRRHVRSVVARAHHGG